MKSVHVHISATFFILLLITHPMAMLSIAAPYSLSFMKVVQPANVLGTSSSSDKRNLVLQSIYSEADYLLASQNKNLSDRFTYGDFYVDWWSHGQWVDPEEARAQEPVYLLAWLYAYDSKYQSNQTVLSTIIRAIDRYCRWQLDGSSGRIGLTYVTTAFMASVLRAYRLIQNADLSRITEFNNTLGDINDINTNYELYLSASDRWISGDGFRVASMDNDYFVLYTTAPAQNRRVFSNPTGWLDRQADGYVDFDLYFSIQFFDNFIGSIPIKIADNSNGDWNTFPVVANITGNASGEWEWSNFTVPSNKLWIDRNGKISFLIENRLAPFKIRQIMVQIDRRSFWMETFENAGDYLNTFFSVRALNQEAGAMYSLYLLYNITGDTRFLKYYNEKMLRFESSQSDGVFPEMNSIYSNDNWWISGYDGDYIHVSMYWLAMLYRENRDESVFQMLNSSVNFMAYLYFPQGQWEAGFSIRTSTSSPFGERMAPLYMIPYFAMSQKNGYAARIAEIYCQRIYFNKLSSSPDWYRHLLNPVTWVDLYESLFPDPNPRAYRLPIESNDWYLKDFPKIKILVIKTSNYAAFLSYGNNTPANALADIYQIESGKHLISGRGDINSPWGFGVISLNYKDFNSYEIQPTMTILNNTSDAYLIDIDGHLRTPTFTTVPVSFQMNYSFFNDSIAISTNIDFEEDAYVESLLLGATPVNPSQLDLLVMRPDLLAQKISLENSDGERILKYGNTASVFFDDFGLRSEGPSKSLTVLDMSNSTASPYGFVEYVGWNLVDKGRDFARGSNITFKNTLTFENITSLKETYVDVDHIADYISSLQRLIIFLAITNIVVGTLLIGLIISTVHHIFKERHGSSKNENVDQQLPHNRCRFMRVHDFYAPNKFDKTRT